MTERLENFLAERRTRAFRYGRHDCVLLVAEWLGDGYVALLHDLYPYDGVRSGRRQLRAAGGLTAAVSRHLGAPVPRAQLRPGDVARLAWPRRDDGYHEYLGIMLVSQVVVPARRGTIALALDFVTEGWHADLVRG